MLALSDFRKVRFFSRSQGVGVGDCACFLQAVNDGVRAGGDEDRFGLEGEGGLVWGVGLDGW